MAYESRLLFYGFIKYVLLILAFGGLNYKLGMVFSLFGGQ